MMKKIIALLFIFIMVILSCNDTKDKNMDSSIQDFMSLNLPWSCRMAYVCWKTRGKVSEMSACEKYSIPCASKVKEIDDKTTKELIEKVLKKLKDN